MSSEERVQRALRALADHDREREAPAEVEVRVLQEFRQARRRQMLRRASVLSAAIAAAAAIVLFLPVGQEPAEQPRQVVEPVVEPLDVVASTPDEPVVQAGKPTPAPRREIVTQFFALTDSALPLDRGQLLRVRVPASVMYSVGLPVNPDRWMERVDADVLVGEEGMARAIRFVGYQQ